MRLMLKARLLIFTHGWRLKGFARGADDASGEGVSS